MNYYRIAILIFSIVLVMSQVAAGQDKESSKKGWPDIVVSSSSEVGDTTTGPHGGRILRRERFIFETLFDANGIRVYVSDTAEGQLKLKGVTGSVKFPKDSGGFHNLVWIKKKDPRKWLPRMRSSKTKRGYYLFAPYDFSFTPDGSMRMRLEFAGLPGQEANKTGYAVLFGLTRLRGYVCRGHENRIYLEYKDYPLCDKEYLDNMPYLYQCFKHPNSRSDHPSKCPLCSDERIPVRHSMDIYFQPKESPGKRK